METNKVEFPFLMPLSEESDFVRNQETEWAYRRVLTHLDDGAESMRAYVKLSEVAEYFDYTLDRVFFDANRIIAGTRSEEDDEYLFVGAGHYPTKLDQCAFLYYHMTRP